MRFEPKTEQEVSNLLEPGEADFAVRTAEEKQSKSGNDMIELLVEAFDKSGKKATVKDYLMDAIPHKLRHFAYAVGLGHAYESGELAAEMFVGKGGRCKVAHEIDRTGHYPPKNKIVDYVMSEKTQEQPNYQTSKKEGIGGVVLEQSKRAAWENWKAQYTGDPTMLETEWRKTLRAYFGALAKESIGYIEWQKFLADGFVKPQSPIGEEAAFKDTDIPF